MLGANVPGLLGANARCQCGEAGATGGHASDGWYETHPRFVTRLNQEQMEEIEDVLRQHGVSKRDFLLAAAKEWASRRSPESQGGVKVIVDGKTILIDMEDIEAAVVAVEREADQQHRIASTFTDPQIRATHNKIAGKYHNASMLLHQVIQAGARRRDGKVVHRSRGMHANPQEATAAVRAAIDSARGLG